ncbi:MAG: hypothetical protein SGCHY_002121 [Lobulomycetales sp.]
MQEQSREYLEASQVSVYFEDVVASLLSDRPEDPVEYIADYFAKCKTGANTINRNYSYVKSTLKNRVNFVTQFRATMNEQDFFTCYELQQLLELLCENFPLEVTVTAVKILGHGSGQFKEPGAAFGHSEVHLRESGLGNERVNFGRFSNILRIFLAYHEFFAETASLLQECSGGLIKVGNLTIGQADLRALEDAFKLSLRKSYGKSSSKTLPRYTRIREAVQWSKIYNKLSTTEAVATLWFSFAYQLSESMIDD